METGSEWGELGIIQSAEQECPGVWLVSVAPENNAGIRVEYYVVRENTPAISKEAKKYGQRLDSHPEILLFPLYGESGGWKAIEYELQKNQIKNGLPLPEDKSLLETAWEGMEVHPAYFGAYPVPTVTPLGYTLRHKTICNGVYWLETVLDKQVIAIYRGMCDDLSDMALALACPDDREMGLPDTWGYFFFAKKASCIPIFEMLTLHPGWVTDRIVDKAALMNAVCRHYPQYAISYNLREQAGENDMLGKMTQDQCPEYELNGALENMLAFSEDTDIEFWTFLQQNIENG